MSRRSVLQALMSGNYYIGYYPTLAHALGAPSAAIFLAKIAEWEPYSDDGWVFRKGEDLHKETALTRDMQRTARRILRSKGVMEENNHQVHGKLMYKIDWPKLEKVLINYESSHAHGENPHLPGEKPPSKIGNNPTSYNNVSEQRNEEVVGRSTPTPFTLFCDLLIAEGLEPTDEDRQTIPGNLNRVVKKLEPGEKIGPVIRHMVDRRARGKIISPQRALNDVRTGNTNGAAVQPSPDHVIEAFKSSDDRMIRRWAYLGHEWDFTREELPVTRVLLELGNSPEERTKWWKRMRRVALKAREDGDGKEQST